MLSLSLYLYLSLFKLLYLHPCSFYTNIYIYTLSYLHLFLLPLLLLYKLDKIGKVGSVKFYSIEDDYFLLLKFICFWVSLYNYKEKISFFSIKKNAH